MTKLQSLIEILQNNKSIQELEKFITENFYNQEEDEYNIEDTCYFILTEDEVQDLLDERFEEELYEASEALAYKRHYDIARIVANLDSDHNYLRAYKDAEKVNNYTFIGKTDNYYIYQEEC